MRTSVSWPTGLRHADLGLTAYKGVVCFTGTLSEPRSVWAKRAIEHGWEVSDRVTNRTTYLVKGSLTKAKSMKETEAERWSISVVDEEYFADLLNLPTPIKKERARKQVDELSPDTESLRGYFR